MLFDLTSANTKPKAQPTLLGEHDGLVYVAPSMPENEHEYAAFNTQQQQQILQWNDDNIIAQDDYLNQISTAEQAKITASNKYVHDYNVYDGDYEIVLSTLTYTPDKTKIMHDQGVYADDITNLANIEQTYPIDQSNVAAARTAINMAETTLLDDFTVAQPRNPDALANLKQVVTDLKLVQQDEQAVYAATDALAAVIAQGPPPSTPFPTFTPALSSFTYSPITITNGIWAFDQNPG
jgi:hypothetical protein